IFKSC
ncbi:hypothetical protein VCHENC02_4619B, partial [Vibrio harveyi]